MKTIKLVYPAFADMDIFLVHGHDWLGDIVSFGEAHSIADTIATHAGFAVSRAGQFCALEMNPQLMEKSLEEYTGGTVQMIELWRYQQWDADKKAAAIAKLELLLRQKRDDYHYDPIGAVMSSPLGKKLFGWLPWMKQAPGRWFCSEEVCSIMREFADDQIPAELDPQDLGQYMRRRGNLIYKPVQGWKI